MSEPPDADDLEITSQVLSTVASGIEPGPWPETLPLAARVAEDWQNLGTRANFSELKGRLAGLPGGRLSEIIGRIASAGEQLGLSWTFEQDMLRWDHLTVRHGAARTLAARSLAEITGYYALSAGHGLLNVTLRTLLANQDAAEVIDKAYKGARGFPPYTDTRQTWLPINEHGAQNLRRAADAAAQPAATVLVDLVANLTRDPRWVAMTNRRDTDFHRWRPQSVSGGVATFNPWEPTPHGGFRMRAYATSQHRPPETGPLMAEASAGLEALATTMDDWLTAWPAALRSLGVALFTQDRP